MSILERAIRASLLLLLTASGCSSSVPSAESPKTSPTDCAELGADCPEACQPIGGWLIDTERACQVEEVVWGCASPTATFAGVLQCSVSTDGAVYVSGLGQLYPNSRECTEQEAERYINLASCEP